MASDLEALLTRVEKAEGPDREIDFDLFRALHPLDTWQPNGWRITRYKIAPAGIVHAWTNGLKHLGVAIVPKWTASVDAVLGLIEREMPGHRWGVTGPLGAAGGKRLFHGFLEHDEGNAATPALALLAAFLRAKIEASDG